MSICFPHLLKASSLYLKSETVKAVVLTQEQHDTNTSLRQTNLEQPAAGHKLKWVGCKGNSDVQWRQEAASRTPTTNTPIRYVGQQHMLVGGK